MLTVFGAGAVTLMMVMYRLRAAAEGSCSRSRPAARCQARYGFLVGVWPFGIVEAIWSLVALRRYRAQPSRPRTESAR
jgi:hypothetical protein